MSFGGLALIRLAAVLLVLSLASPALALPVSYDFVATEFYGFEAYGSLTYDAETDALTLTSFVAPVVGLWGGPVESLPAFDWVGAEFWPEATDRFPVDSAGVRLYRSSEYTGTDGLVVETDVDFVGLFAIDPYEHGCAVGTPLADCPFDSFGSYHEQAYGLSTVQIVPELSAVATLLLAAAALLAMGSCRPFPLRR